MKNTFSKLFDLLRYFYQKHSSLRAKFIQIHRTGGFGGTRESHSGVGSTEEITRRLRENLAALFSKLRVKSILDAPCGDFNWMQYIDFGTITYFGMDIVPEIVQANRSRFGRSGRIFFCGDIRNSGLPDVDLIICRDCLVHLSHHDALKALNNFLLSNAKWLLLSTFPNLPENADLISGMGWRALNMQLAPYHLPMPTELIFEAETDQLGGLKALGLWTRQQLQESLYRR